MGPLEPASVPSRQFSWEAHSRAAYCVPQATRQGSVGTKTKHQTELGRISDQSSPLR